MTKRLQMPNRNFPIVLQSDLITIGGAGAQYVLDPQKMQNPANQPMLIDEIRFWLSNPALAPVIFAGLQVGRQMVTAGGIQGGVPIWCLGPTINAGASPAFTSKIGLDWVYRPPKPIYVPKYSNLQCIIIADPTMSALIDPTNAQVRVAFAGRQLDQPLGVEVDVPWAAKWLPPAFVNGVLNNDQRKWRSGQNDLAAPFEQALHVKSMIGRIVGVNNGNGPDVCESYPSIPDKYMTMKMQAANGAVVARDPIPFGRVFDVLTGEWQLDATIDRKSYLIANLSCDLRTVNPGNNIYAQMALHGYRTVSIKEYTA